MGGYILAQKLEIERSKSFAGSILLQTKAIRSQFRVPGLENIPLFPGNRAEVSQNLDARKAVSATLSVLKSSRDRLARIVILTNLGSISRNWGDIFYFRVL